jgi:hypothetical protein
MAVFGYAGFNIIDDTGGSGTINAGTSIVGIANLGAGDLIVNRYANDDETIAETYTLATGFPMVTLAAPAGSMFGKITYDASATRAVITTTGLNNPN